MLVYARSIRCVRFPVAMVGLALAFSLVFAPAAPHAEESEKEETKMIEAGSMVGLEYTLTLEDGTKVDSNVGGEALRFRQGAGQIIPGLEKELLGMRVGDSKQVKLSAEQGYGPVDPNAFQEVPLSELPEDARAPGTRLMARDQEGNSRPLRVHTVEGDTATLDFNHPLAGQALTFDVKILEIQ